MGCCWSHVRHVYGGVGGVCGVGCDHCFVRVGVCGSRAGLLG